jgi:hypothetical protein
MMLVFPICCGHAIIIKCGAFGSPAKNISIYLVNVWIFS